MTIFNYVNLLLGILVFFLGLYALKIKKKKNQYTNTLGYLFVLLGLLYFLINLVYIIWD